MRKLKSLPLRPGAAIGIIAPASPVRSGAEVETAVALLTGRGFRIVLGETTAAGTDYLSGDDRKRRRDLEKLWSDPAVAALWALRGGYGCLRILERLNYRLFEANPKILMGFSDLTALELGLWARLKLVSFHGPVLTTLKSEFSLAEALLALSGEFDGNYRWPAAVFEKLVTIRNGKARGILVGGNLATLVSLVGTGFLPDFTDTVLFIEEVGEADYRIDRMLTQLLVSGLLEKAAAILVGRSVPVEGQTESDLIKVFSERLQLLNCPSAYGFPIGHLREVWTLPQGIMVETDTGRGILRLLENPFR